MVVGQNGRKRLVERMIAMQETVATILEYVTKWLTVCFAICGSIVAIGLVVFIAIVLHVHMDEKKRKS